MISKRRFLLPLLFISGFLILIHSCVEEESNLIKTDICIYGGTAAGVTAAIQASKMGADVLLVAPEKYLGGMAVQGLGGTDINNHRTFKNDAALGGLALEFYEKIANQYGRVWNDSTRQNRDTWRFESSVAREVYQEMLEEADVNILTEERLIYGEASVTKTDSRITEVRLESGKTISAKYFMDATIEGDLLAFAGISTFVGREANDQYGETKNGIRHENTYRQFEVEVDPYLIPGDSASGLIATISNDKLGELGTSDNRIQAYCFRACLTDSIENQIVFKKPLSYDSTNYEIYLRYLEAGGNLYKPKPNLPNRKTDLGAWHDLSHNLYGMNHCYPKGNYEIRDSIIAGHLEFTQGLFYFLANDRRVPALVRQEWSRWGTTKDEFQENDGWPSMFYIREARRMVSDYVITEHHTTGAEVANDPIAVSYWPPDTHHVRRIVRDGKAYNEGFVFGGDDWMPFGISYQSMIPKRSECVNLITPTCLSSTHVAYGAIRLEWTFMALGQSAGLAAVQALEYEQAFQDVDYGKLKKELLEIGQVLEL